MRSLFSLRHVILTANIFYNQTVALSVGSLARTTSSLPSSSTSCHAQSTLIAAAAPSVQPNIDDPSAVNAQSVCPGYKAINVQTSKTGLTADLRLAGSACNVYGIDIEALNLTVEYQTASRLHVLITPSVLSPANASQYVLSPGLVSEGFIEEPAGFHTLYDLQFTWSNEPSFQFNISRTNTGEVLFSTSGIQLVFENQFLEFATAMPDNYNMYGLGEVIHSLRLGNNLTRTLYAANAGNNLDTNVYGSHPFYLETRYFQLDDKGNEHLVTNTSDAPASREYRSYSHGVFFRNSHGQDILLRPSNVTWRAIGGSIDLYFFSGPSADAVTQQYLDLIGLPAMHRYHTLGLHQCRWGYSNWSELEEVITNYAHFNIPLENIWNDIDYMSFYRDFENDPIRYGYAEGSRLIDKLHAQGQYYIPIVDAGIYVPNPHNSSDSYTPFARGNDSNVFLSNPDGSMFIGAVWPGYTAFPDWLDPATQDWWTDEMRAWHGKIAWDGIWLDMSEASSDCAGSCGTGNLHLQPIITQTSLPGEAGNLVLDYPEGFNLTNSTEAAAAAAASSSELAASASTKTPAISTTVSYVRSTPGPTRNVELPPYVVNNVEGALSAGAISSNASHYDGTLEYDIHNLFGHAEMKTTYNAQLAISPNRRPFIIARSTFAGSGQYGGHWGGDNNSKWGSMWFSISQALSFQLFGMPMFGVDTCGFGGNTDEELCNRWMQLSAFFPFYRNHNVLGAIPQEPYRWASVIDATITAQRVRFALLPYMYTLLHQAHTKGSTVMRALAWNFPNDPSLASADQQFFLGDAILITPVLEQGASSVNGVFPGLLKGTDVYYDWYNLSQISMPLQMNTTITAPLGHIPVYLRGGNVLATQEMAMTTSAARLTPWSIIIALGISGEAQGSMYLDDGESLVPDATKTVKFSATESSLAVEVHGDYVDNNKLEMITILGLSGVPAGPVTISGKTITDATISWNATNNATVIGGVFGRRAAAFESSWKITW